MDTDKIEARKKQARAWFEALRDQIVAALEAVEKNVQDSEDPVSGGLDVLAQHVLGTACAGPFDPVKLFDEVTRAWPYRELSWETFERAAINDVPVCLMARATR